MNIVNSYTELLTENKELVQSIVEKLKGVYEPADGVQWADESAEFETKPVIMRIIDKKPIEPMELLDYISKDYHGLAKAFIILIIRKWFNGEFDGDDPDYAITDIVSM